MGAPLLHSPAAVPDALAIDPRRHRRWLRACAAYARWLRVRTAGLDGIPPTGPALLVGNHAGLRSTDHLALQARVAAARGRPVRGLAHRSVERIPVVGRAHVAYAGAAIGRRDTALRLLAGGELVALYPEGGASTDKPFAARDRVLERPAWTDGWATVALESGAPIVPLGFSGFEATAPTLGRSRRLGRLWGLDGDYPVTPQTPLTLTVPWLAGALPLPVRCAIVAGPPTSAAELLGRAAGPEDAAALSAAVRERVVALVAAAADLRR